MEIHVFGKQSCAKCESTKNKLGHFITKMGIDEKVSVTFFDMDTVDGMAEGAFQDVNDIPVTIVQDSGVDLARWDGEIPDSETLKSHLATA
ncbi:thioredoxin family protein [bacterium]|nr:thioredoxin family protein [bacterium]